VKKLNDAHEAYKQNVTSSCVVSNRVYINSIADRNKKSDKLGVGYGGDGKKIGPEYAFGLSIAEKIDGPILLIKTSWGGKSLHYNFRPPSAGAYELNEKEKSGDKANEIKKNAGLNYRMMNEAIHKVLDNLKDHHPAYDAKAGYEIAGFVWFQGFNDHFSPEFRDNYKANMISFIKDVRKEYKVPNMPFVIGVLGTGATAEKVAENPVSVGQREAAKAPEFKDNVAAIESYTEYSLFSNEVFKKGWPKHYHEWDTVGSDRPYHYLFERDGTLYSTYGGLKSWNAKKRTWDRAARAGGTDETMRVGNGTLTFGDSRVTWNGKAILDPPIKGSYQLFFYANGHLCFYHVNKQDRSYRLYKNDEDGFSRLYACPWTPSQGKVDLGKSVVLWLPVVGETTFAWGQLHDQIVTGSNIGGFYVFQNGTWKMLLEPKLGVSYQLYSTLAFHDRLLMGQFPTGRVFAYDGKQITDQKGWPPVLKGVSASAREAQTTAIYGGDLMVGVWPWGEVWRYNVDSRGWAFMRRMFIHPELSSARISHLTPDVLA